jgi:Zinc-finger of C2H2 type
LKDLLEKCFIPFNSPLVYKTFEKIKKVHCNDLTKYHCNICNTFISGFANLQMHYEGQKHSTTFEKLTNSLALDLTMDVGEEDDVILGFEYIIELVESGKEKIIYCRLCDKSFHSKMYSNLVEHLKSRDHNEKYLVNRCNNP